MKFHKTTYLKLLILVAVLLITFFESIVQSVINSISTGTWRLFLIPLVWVIFKEEYRNTSLKYKENWSNYLSLPIIFVAFSSQYFARWAGINILYEISIIMAMFSLFALFTGGKGFYRFKWSLFYLFFLSTLSDELIFPLQNILRLISSKTVILLMGGTGFPVVHDGTNIRLTNLIMNVAAECSGVNQLVSLFLITIPLSLLILKKSVLRLILVLATFPIALFSNVVRLYIIGVWNYRRIEFSHGPHGLLAMSSIFVLGLVLTYLFGVILQRVENKRGVFQKKIGSIANFSLVSSRKIYVYIVFNLICFTLFLFSKPVNDSGESLTHLKSDSSWVEIDNPILMYSDTSLANDKRFVSTYVDRMGNKVLLEINNYSIQDSKKKLELTPYILQRFLMTSKIFRASISENKNINYAFGYNSIDGRNTNKRATLLLYFVNDTFMGNRRFLKIEIMKRLLLNRKNSGSVISITLINKGTQDVSDRELLETFIADVIIRNSLLK